MNILLVQISLVQVGVPFRAGLDIVANGDVAVIQMRDTSQPTVDLGALARADVELKGDRHWIQTGDILFRSRGLSTTASIVRDAPPKTVAAAPLMRIRVTAIDLVLPEYLNWYLNQSPAQAYFSNQAKGTMQMMVDKTTLENLEVSLPSLETQRHIVALAGLADREQGLMHILAEKHRKLTNKMILQLLEKV